MKVGVIVPQGWTGEYDGWDPVEAWERTVAVAQQAEALGFESIWMFDHFHTIPEPTEEITFESLGDDHPPGCGPLRRGTGFVRCRLQGSRRRNGLTGPDP